MMQEVFHDVGDRMEKSIQAFQKDLAILRAGRATPALLERIVIDYYGQPTPISQVASISVPEPRILLIQPWDKGTVKDIEKAILKSDLGMTPISDGSLIRLPVPQMTEERRVELVRTVRKKGEECKVAVRNIRREGNDLLKDLEKGGDISEDDLKRGQEEVQKLTDKWVDEVQKMVDSKEREIMEV